MKQSLLIRTRSLARSNLPDIGTPIFLSLALWASALAGSLRAGDIEQPPIRYSDAPCENAVTRLQQRIDTGELQLAFEDRLGYLPSVLRALGIPQSSQMLVFSKTSLQRDRISPKTPRALYFNDEVYIGFCQRGALMEVTAVDPKLGAVFYSLDQKPADKPRFVRQNDACLICHGSSQNQGFPGHLLRSVYADARGYPILSLGTRRIDQSSPLRERWGGWYVTGTSGQQGHLGNLIAQEGQQADQLDNTAGRNVTNLSSRLVTTPYPTPHSDIVALMVLEHQAEMHNRITRANFLTQMALYEEAELNMVLGRPAEVHSESTLGRIRSAGEPVVQYLLFSGETKLTEPVQGTSGFAQEFAQRGPRDDKGRSLRDLDLQHRLFRYPCSYLIYSTAFEGLPAPVKDYVWRRLWEVLTGKETSPAFAHLSSADRQAIREILLATKPQLPAYWQTGSDH
jgi:hypothetical protein